MKIEQESFNLVMAPLLASFFSFANNERVMDDQSNFLDFFVLTCFMVCRALILIGFLYHISYETSPKHKYLWIVFYAFCSILYLAGFGTYWIYSGYYPETMHLEIRRVTNYGEMFSIPCLIMW